jgi:hypothetical protein
MHVGARPRTPRTARHHGSFLECARDPFRDAHRLTVNRANTAIATLCPTLVSADGDSPAKTQAFVAPTVLGEVGCASGSRVSLCGTATHRETINRGRPGGSIERVARPTSGRSWRRTPRSGRRREATPGPPLASSRRRLRLTVDARRSRSPSSRRRPEAARAAEFSSRRARWRVPGSAPHTARRTHTPTRYRRRCSSCGGKLSTAARFSGRPRSPDIRCGIVSRGRTSTPGRR